jgi:hypothetical protein
MASAGLGTQSQAAGRESLGLPGCRPAAMALFLLLLVSALAGLASYKTQPVPHYVQYTVTAPALTEY